MEQVMLYGASGYTGALIAREAVRQGLRPILAGRSREKLIPLAQELGLEARSFGLERPEDLREHLAGVTVLLNAGGPFKHTSTALASACLQTGTHYLDLAGEVPEFEALLARDGEAKAAGVMLVPGVGFGVVPTDSLAVYLKARLPGATRLTLAFETVGGVSSGTAETVIADLPRGGVARRNGRLVREAAGLRSRRIDFGFGPTAALSNPWRGDLSTAYHSTGIPTIETYMVVPSPLRELMRASRFIGPLLGLPFVQRLLMQQAHTPGGGPTAAERAAGRTAIWGEVADAGGRRVAARLTGPEAYDFTALTAVLTLQQILSGTLKPGFQTPAQLLGADAVLRLPGVIRTDL